MRAIKAAIASGFPLSQIKIEPNGTLVLQSGTESEVRSAEVDRELAEFEARHAL